MRGVISVRSEKALQREKDTTGKESDRRKKRLKGNQIEIPRRRYRGFSRYGVYKWKAMNRWIRGKEIKAEAEWTARWVFRYDKSPRKSLRSLPPSLFLGFLRTSPQFASAFACPPASLSLSCRFLLTLFYFSSLFFLPYGSSSPRRNCAIFRFSDRYSNERIRGERDENDTLTHEFPFDSHRDAILSLRSESHDSRKFLVIPSTDRISLACRFKLAVKIVDFNILKKLHSCPQCISRV